MASCRYRVYQSSLFRLGDHGALVVVRRCANTASSSHASVSQVLDDSKHAIYGLLSRDKAIAEQDTRAQLAECRAALRSLRSLPPTTGAASSVVRLLAATSSVLARLQVPSRARLSSEVVTVIDACCDALAIRCQSPPGASPGSSSRAHTSGATAQTLLQLLSPQQLCVVLSAAGRTCNDSEARPPAGVRRALEAIDTELARRDAADMPAAAASSRAVASWIDGLSGGSAISAAGVLGLGLGPEPRDAVVGDEPADLAGMRWTTSTRAAGPRSADPFRGDLGRLRADHQRAGTSRWLLGARAARPADLAMAAKGVARCSLGRNASGMPALRSTRLALLAAVADRFDDAADLGEGLAKHIDSSPAGEAGAPGSVRWQRVAHLLASSTEPGLSRAAADLFSVRPAASLLSALSSLCERADLATAEGDVLRDAASAVADSLHAACRLAVAVSSLARAEGRAAPGTGDPPPPCVPLRTGDERKNVVPALPLSSAAAAGSALSSLVRSGAGVTVRDAVATLAACLECAALPGSESAEPLTVEGSAIIGAAASLLEAARAPGGEARLSPGGPPDDDWGPLTHRLVGAVMELFAADGALLAPARQPQVLGDQRRPHPDRRAVVASHRAALPVMGGSASLAAALLREWQPPVPAVAAARGSKPLEAQTADAAVAQLLRLGDGAVQSLAGWQATEPAEAARVGAAAVWGLSLRLAMLARRPAASRSGAGPDDDPEGGSAVSESVVLMQRLCASLTNDPTASLVLAELSSSSLCSLLVALSRSVSALEQLQQHQQSQQNQQQRADGSEPPAPAAQAAAAGVEAIRAAAERLRRRMQEGQSHLATPRASPSLRGPGNSRHGEPQPRQPDGGDGTSEGVAVESICLVLGAAAEALCGRAHVARGHALAARSVSDAAAAAWASAYRYAASGPGVTAEQTVARAWRLLGLIQPAGAVAAGDAIAAVVSGKTFGRVGPPAEGVEAMSTLGPMPSASPRALLNACWGSAALIDVASRGPARPDRTAVTAPSHTPWYPPPAPEALPGVAPALEALPGEAPALEPLHAAAASLRRALPTRLLARAVRVSSRLPRGELPLWQRLARLEPAPLQSPHGPLLAQMASDACASLLPHPTTRSRLTDTTSRAVLMDSASLARRMLEARCWPSKLVALVCEAVVAKEAEAGVVEWRLACEVLRMLAACGVEASDAPGTADAPSLAARACLASLARHVGQVPADDMRRESVRGRATSIRAAALLGTVGDVEAVGPWLLAPQWQSDAAAQAAPRSVLQGPSRASLAGALLRVAHRLIASGADATTAERVVGACGLGVDEAAALLAMEAGLGGSTGESALQAAVRDAVSLAGLHALPEHPIPLCPAGASPLGETFLRDLVMRVDLALPGQKVAIEVDGPTHFVPPAEPDLWGAEPHNGPAIATADERAVSVLLGPDGGAVSETRPEDAASALAAALAGRPRTPATAMRDAVLRASGWQVVSLGLPDVLQAVQAGGQAELSSRVQQAVAAACLRV